MNTELRAAIYNIGKEVTGLAGGFWYIEASKDALLPYSVFSNVTSTRDKDSSDKFDFIYLQINGYHKYLSVLENIQKDFENRFDGQRESFTMTNYWLIDIELLFNRGPIKINEVYQFTQQYKLHIQHK